MGGKIVERGTEPGPPAVGGAKVLMFSSISLPKCLTQYQKTKQFI